MKYALIFVGLLVAGGIAYAVTSSQNNSSQATVSGVETEMDLSGVCPPSHEEEPCE
jgi:hypothetical protein